MPTINVRGTVIGYTDTGALDGLPNAPAIVFGALLVEDLGPTPDTAAGRPYRGQAGLRTRSRGRPPAG
jgi:hypothetical protein